MTLRKALLSNYYSLVIWENRRSNWTTIVWMGNSNTRRNYHNYEKYDSQVRIICIYILTSNLLFISHKNVFFCYIMCCVYFALCFIIKYMHFILKNNINLQYSLSDLLGGSCITAAQASNDERRSWSRASHRR